jgi:hypothetical protein
MSYRVTALVRAARLPKAMKHRPEVKAVLLALANRCDDAGKNAWPSVATIASETELSSRTAQKRLSALRDSGIIRQQEPPRQHRPRTWRLDLGVLEELAAPQDVAGLDASGAQNVADLKVGRGRVQTGNRTGQVGKSEAPDLHDRPSGLQHVADDPVLLNRPSLNSPLNKEPRASRETPGVATPEELAEAAYRHLPEAARQQLEEDAAGQLSGVLSIAPPQKRQSFIRNQVLLYLRDPRVRQQYAGGVV